MDNPIRGLRVLVVDDDPASAKLCAVILRGEGCEVEVAVDAEAAAARLPDLRPQMIVLDLLLPRVSGLAFAQRVKADATTADIPIIVVTVFNGPDPERLVAEAGCAAYIRKPFEPATLVAAMCSHRGGAS